MGCGEETDVKLVCHCLESQDAASEAARAEQAAARAAAGHAAAAAFRDRARRLMGEVPGGADARGPMAVIGPQPHLGDGPGGGVGGGLGDDAAGGDGDRCGNCFCRPMWCASCMARWFAQRQLLAERPTDSWLRGRAPCPTCRSPFCILDVSRLSRVQPAASHQQ